MNKADRFSASVWFIFSLFVSYFSYKLGMGSLRQPGPGFVFFWTAIIVAMLSLAVVVMSFVEKPKKEEKEGHIFRIVGVKKVALVVIALLLYTLFMESAGFIIMTLLLLVFLLRVIEKKTWLLALSVGVTVTTLSYLVFETVLQCQLPKGLLEYIGF